MDNTRREDATNSEPILLGDTVAVVGCDRAACPWHILHDNLRLTRDKLIEMSGDSPGIKIRCTPSRGPRDEANGFAFVEGGSGCRCLRPGRVRQYEKRK